MIAGSKKLAGWFGDLGDCNFSAGKCKIDNPKVKLRIVIRKIFF